MDAIGPSQPWGTHTCETHSGHMGDMCPLAPCKLDASYWQVTGNVLSPLIMQNEDEEG